jgi:hypothetical protein
MFKRKMCIQDIDANSQSSKLEQVIIITSNKSEIPVTPSTIML